MGEVSGEDIAAEALKRVWPFTVNLKHPVQLGELTTVTSLTLRRGKLGDLKGVKLSGEIAADSLMLVASRMCGQPLKVIESLDPEDAQEVMALVLDFFGKCLGGNSA